MKPPTPEWLSGLLEKQSTQFLQELLDNGGSDPIVDPEIVAVLKKRQGT